MCVYKPQIPVIARSISDEAISATQYLQKDCFATLEMTILHHYIDRLQELLL